MAELWTVQAGTALKRLVTLRDESGNAVTTFNGAESLSLTIWEGSNQAATSTTTSSIVWTDPSAGAVTITLGGTDTATWAAGEQRLQAYITYGGSTYPIFRDPVLLAITAAAGSAATLSSYCTFADCRLFASWVTDLIEFDPTLSSDLAEYRHRARTWFDEWIVAAFTAQQQRRQRNGFLLWTSAGSWDVWLRDQLDAGVLMTDGWRGDRIREINARAAIAFLCEQQIGDTAEATAYQAAGKDHWRRALNLAGSYTCYLDVNSDGKPDILVPLGLKVARA